MVVALWHWRVTRQVGRFILRWPLIRMRRWCKGRLRVGRMKQIIRELKRQVAGEKLEPEQLKGLIRGGYVYRNGDEHLLTDLGREALAQPSIIGSGDGEESDTDNEGGEAEKVACVDERRRAHPQDARARENKDDCDCAEVEAD
jgi:hypothetical protein